MSNSRQKGIRSWSAPATTVLVTLVLFGCDFSQISDLIGSCKDKIIIGDISPDGRYVAIVYQRDCGALGGVATHINIRPRATKFEGRGKDSIFTIEGLFPIGVVWTDNSRLRVECIRCAPDRVLKQEKMWQDVAISYESYGN